MTESMNRQEAEQAAIATTAPRNEYGFAVFEIPADIEGAAALQAADLAFCREMQATGQHFVAACVQLAIIHDKLARAGRYGGGAWLEWCKRRGLSRKTADNMRHVGEKVNMANLATLNALDLLPRTVLYSACSGECSPITWELLTSDDPQQQEKGRALLEAEQKVAMAQKELRQAWESMRAAVPAVPPGATLEKMLARLGCPPADAVGTAAWLNAETWEEAQQQLWAWLETYVQKLTAAASKEQGADD